jgi:hypothetical protein
MIPWEEWPPYVEAKAKWDETIRHLTIDEIEELGSFGSSSEYLAARLAYRRYANHSPSTETT